MGGLKFTNTCFLVVRPRVIPRSAPQKVGVIIKSAKEKGRVASDAISFEDLDMPALSPSLKPIDAARTIYSYFLSGIPHKSRQENARYRLEVIIHLVAMLGTEFRNRESDRDSDINLFLYDFAHMEKFKRVPFYPLEPCWKVTCG